MPALANIVEYVWASSGAPAHACERVVPTGTLELFVSLVDDKRRVHGVGGGGSFSGAGVAGAYRRPFSFETAETASVLGVHFRPGRAAAVLGVPPGELMDQHVDLEALWGRSARELRDRLREARSTPERFAILEAALVARLVPDRVHPTVIHALGALTRPEARVVDVAKHVGLSQRRLIELFTAIVGITPKRFGRVMRFQRATELAQRSSLDWTRVAHECGYYDQAHLIRDFHELADMTPRELSRTSVHAREHHQFAVAAP